MAGIVIQPTATPPKAAFNEAAFAKTFVDANKAVLEQSSWASWGKTLTGHNALSNIDVDATIKAAPVDTTLAAIVAGDPKLKEFVDTVSAHPDLKDGIAKVLQNEGQKGLEGFQSLMTGDGAVNSADLKAMLDDPMKRGLAVQMLNAVGTDEFGMDYAGRFMKSAMKASKDPNDATARQEFLGVAAEAGIDPAAEYKQETMGAFMGFLGDTITGRKSVKDGMTDLQGKLKGLGLDENSLQSIQNLLGPIAGFMQFLFKDFAQFGMKWGPIMADKFNNVMGDVQTVSNGFDKIQEKIINGEDPRVSFETPADPNRTAALNLDDRNAIRDVASANFSGERLDGYKDPSKERDMAYVPQVRPGMQFNNVGLG